MDPGPDELAGAVDGFGGLTRTELLGAFDDLAARSGAELDAAALEGAIEDAIEAYYLLAVGADAVDVPADELTGGPPVLVVGPAALPRLPAGGEDLPHLLDVEPRAVDRAAVAEQVEGRLRADAAAAIADDDPVRAARLLDACYEVEAWSPVDLTDAKAGLADVLE